MSRIAFFVEGLTEILFTERFLVEVAGKNNMKTVKKELRGTLRLPLITINSDTAVKHECLLIDCHGDGGGFRVKQAIVDNAESLHKSGCDHIFGLWDLYPH